MARMSKLDATNATMGLRTRTLRTVEVSSERRMKKRRKMKIFHEVEENVDLKLKKMQI